MHWEATKGHFQTPTASGLMCLGCGSTCACSQARTSTSGSRSSFRWQQVQRQMLVPQLSIDWGTIASQRRTLLKSTTAFCRSASNFDAFSMKLDCPNRAPWHGLQLLLLLLANLLLSSKAGARQCLPESGPAGMSLNALPCAHRHI